MPRPSAKSGLISEQAKQRLKATEGRPLFLGDWRDVVMIHYAADPAILQPQVPFRLDLYADRAFVSVVAFSMQKLRFCRGGRFAAKLLVPIAAHAFLNLRTYVRHRNESGIYFLAEWLPNRLSVLLGPPLFGLPYRYGKLDYDHSPDRGRLRGTVESVRDHVSLIYQGNFDPGLPLQPCPDESRDEFLMERYTALTEFHGLDRFFRIWHPPWPQVSADIHIENDSLLRASGPWFNDAYLVGANYSPGFHDVWMGRPQRMANQNKTELPLFAERGVAKCK